MKRLSLILALCCALLAGCAARHEQDAAPQSYALYFLRANLKDAAGDGALQPVDSGIPIQSDADPAETAEALLTALLDGPESDLYESAIPKGTALNSVTRQGRFVSADFSAPYGSLSGVALTLADYAVTLTLTQIPGVSTAKITVNGQTLDYRDKQSFTARDALLFPDGDVVGAVTLSLYFPDASGALVPEERTLNLYEGYTQVEAVAEAVESGPDNRDLSPAFPDGFSVRSAWQEDAICFVNLSSAVLDALPDDANLSLALLSLDQSLRSLETVREVRYLVDGEFLDRYGNVRLSEPYGGA
ncbi:MAG: GerMN domain-containing protein [Oscillospiraceae bacterium]|nr:GerMN domain-containing protein [Oscillospiraceae bacterium]